MKGGRQDCTVFMFGSVLGRFILPPRICPSLNTRLLLALVFSFLRCPRAYRLFVCMTLRAFQHTHISVAPGDTLGTRGLFLLWILCLVSVTTIACFCQCYALSLSLIYLFGCWFSREFSVHFAKNLPAILKILFSIV